MARPREFDVEKVLHEAMEIFWEKGFEGTSFVDIEQRTGVKKASLFAAYGDKRSLFLKALTAYQEQARANARAILSDEDARDAVHRWFRTATASAKGDCARRGCLQVNAIVEFGMESPGVSDAVQTHMDLMSVHPFRGDCARAEVWRLSFGRVVQDARRFPDDGDPGVEHRGEVRRGGQGRRSDRRRHPLGARSVKKFELLFTEG